MAVNNATTIANRRIFIVPSSSIFQLGTEAVLAPIGAHTPTRLLLIWEQKWRSRRDVPPNPLIRSQIPYPLSYGTAGVFRAITLFGAPPPRLSNGWKTRLPKLPPVFRLARHSQATQHREENFKDVVADFAGQN